MSVINARSALATTRGIQLDDIARGLARHRSLQNLDTAARHAGNVMPALRNVREMRAVAVTGCTSGLLAFASLAVKGRLDPEELFAALDRYADGGSAAASPTLKHLHQRRGQRLAWLMLQRHTKKSHLKRAVALLTWLTETHGHKTLSNTGRATWLESLLLLGEIERAREVLNSGSVRDELRWRATVDLANPYLHDEAESANTEAWLAVLNEPWANEGFAPLTVDPSAPTAYLGLHANAGTVAESHASESAPLVSVVISSHQPTVELLYAVRSVLNSSWHNVEILVVDDASGSEYADTYRDVANLDERVTVHAMNTNGGTYAVRNWALENAHGRYLTFHDSDDWMHPQRIAIQMAFLTANPRVLACVTRSLRVTESMALVNHRSLGAKICEPSLMFERDVIASRLGGFDAVRKGGDAEFRQRLEATQGSPIPVVARAPLTLQLIHHDSLSGGEIRRYWVALHRRIYRAAYEQWHATMASKRLPLRIDTGVGAQRAFYAPPIMREEGGTVTADVVFTVDLLDARRRAEARSVLKQAKILAAEGKLVGIQHVDGPWRHGKMSVNVPEALIAMLNEGSAVMIDGPAATSSKATADS